MLNKSGFVPLDMRVLVMPDPVQEKTAGGVFIPETAQEKEKYATVKATLIAAGENAWEEALTRHSGFVAPKPGDRIILAKYGGMLMKGADGEDYRIMNDADVIARLEE